MKVTLGTVLILFAILWLLGIVVLYSDSFMTYTHSILYSGICVFIIAFGAFLIYSHVRRGKT